MLSDHQIVFIGFLSTSVVFILMPHAMYRSDVKLAEHSVSFPASSVLLPDFLSVFTALPQIFDGNNVKLGEGHH